MAPNSLSPASVVIDYHSIYAPHKMTIPTLEWFPTSITGALGSYQAHNGSPIDAEVMITALINKLKVFMKANSAFDSITVYTQASPSSPNIPRTSLAISIDGTGVTGNEAAISRTWNFKTGLNGNAKLVLLDSPLPSSWFYPILSADFSADELAVVAEFQGSGNAWAGRDDQQAISCRKITFDLNDKLQKQYFR